MTFKTHCQMSKGMVDPAPLVDVVFLLLPQPDQTLDHDRERDHRAQQDRPHDRSAFLHEFPHRDIPSY